MDPAEQVFFFPLCVCECVEWIIKSWVAARKADGLRAAETDQWLQVVAVSTQKLDLFLSTEGSCRQNACVPY